jgi:ABC-type transport system substrate-binding protein
MSNKAKYIYIFLSAIVTGFLLLCGCVYENLVPVSSESIGEERADTELEKVINLSEEEIFLEMKARQDKNPLSDINIRKAILYAIDRKRIINELFGEYSSVPESLFTKDSILWHPAWAEYDFDPDEAKKYLGKAGYGVDNPLYLTISAVNNSDCKEALEGIIKENLSEIGINLWVSNRAPKEFYQGYVYTGNYDLGLWSAYIAGKDELCCTFSSNKIPSMETEENKNCQNFYWYSNKNVDSQLQQLQELADIDEINKKTSEIQDMLASDAALLPLYSRLFVFAFNDNINKVKIDIIGDSVFYDVEDWELASEKVSSEDEKKEITIGYEASHIDIFNGFDQNFISRLLFKGLWKVNDDGLYEPELLGSFNSPEDKLLGVFSNEIVVKLKDNIYWDDGSPVTSEDVAYTIEFFKDYMEKQEYFSELDEDYKKIKEIKIIDQKNFSIIFESTVKDWEKLFLQLFKKDSFGYGNPDDLIYYKIITNGPYRIIKYDPDGTMVLEINEHYYGGLPEIERFVIRFDSDKHNLIAMLEEGEIDGTSIPADLDLMKQLEEDYDINLLIKPGNLMEHLALCMKPKEG